LKAWAKKGISFTYFIQCTLWESLMLQETYFILVESIIVFFPDDSGSKLF